MTEIKILIKNKVVGMIQSLAILPPKENEGHPRIKAQRVRFDKLKITESFAKGFLHKTSQIEPLQIEVHDNDYITTIQNAWITDMPFTYTSHDIVIVDEMDLEAEKVSEKKK